VLAEKVGVLRVQAGIELLENAWKINFCVFRVRMIAMNEQGASSQNQQPNKSLDLQTESLRDSGSMFSNGYRRRAATGESFPEYLPREVMVNGWMC